MSKQFLDYTGLTKFKELSDDHYDEIKNVTWQEYEAIEDKNDDKAYFITDVPPSEQKKTAVKPLPTGSISTVNDAAELPLNALKVSVEAWQEGSGDPSPSNIRPIHGWDSGEIGVVGKNWLHLTIDNIKALNTSGVWDGNSYTLRGVTFTVQTNDSGNITGIKADGTASALASLTIAREVATYMLCPDTSYIFNGCPTGGGTSSFRLRIYINSESQSIDDFGSGVPITTESVQRINYCQVLIQSGYDAQGVVFKPMIRLVTEADSTYEPYHGNQYTLDFPQIIYGAEWDVVGGQLSQTDGYIASYNGETLPSTWISDRDVYASGTTPTIGAEVVYKLATPTTIDLSPLSIRMLQGTNNLYADCGDVVEGEYFGNNTNQIRVNDEIIAGGNSVTFAAESKYAEHAEVADNACTFSVDENGLLTISLVSGDSNNSLSSTRSVKSTTTLPPEEEVKDESVEEEPLENESGITDETENEPSVEEEKDNDDGGEETPPEQNMR